nr:glycosyltransferase [Paenibacillus sp. PL91]
MSMKLSVIIPVYNAEPYIKRCIDSLLKQTIEDYELIFVNDGSTDNSKEIIEHYQKNNAQILLINQGNKGVSLARNAGLAAASGEYVGFVDADDDIEPDMYEKLYAAAKSGDCDVVVSNFESELNGHYLITRYPFPVDVVLSAADIQKQILPFFLKSEQLNTACNKIYRNALIQEHEIVFPAKVALGEDGIFNIYFFSHARKLKYVDYTGYHYRETAESATRNVAVKDYFGRAVEVYAAELPSCYLNAMSGASIQQLKAVKLIHSVMAYIHIYLEPSSNMRFADKIHYVKRMILHPDVRKALPVYVNEMNGELGHYQKALLYLINQKSLLGIYFITAYSRFRNRKARGIII